MFKSWDREVRTTWQVITLGRGLQGRLSQEKSTGRNGEGRACTEFCVNGHLAGHCHLVWRHNELKEPQRT